MKKRKGIHMSLQSRIHDVYPKLTPSEKQIADYLIAQSDAVCSCSVQKLAQDCGSSAPTIVRFSRLLGYSGFPALKMDVMLEKRNETMDETHDIVENESASHLIRTIYRHRLNTLEKARELLDGDTVEAAAEAIEKAGAVYLCGNGTVCLDFVQKLCQIGIRAIYIAEQQMLMASLNSLQENDVLIAISYTGEAESVLGPARIAKEKKALVIGISQLGKTSLKHLADLMLFVPMEANMNRGGAIASRDSSLFVCDAVYLSLVSKNLTENKKKLEMVKNRMDQE
jgi:DNA-binding MurR/RpiR family transcriptional regulator